LSLIAHASPPPSRGARPIALGNGYAGVSGDPYALYYNPAGLYDITQQDLGFDYERSHGEGEFPGSEFSSIYAMPYRFHDKNYPIAVGLNTDFPAPGAHIVDITAGAAGDAMLDVLTKGILKWPAKAGVAATLRQQHGSAVSDRVSKSALGLGVTGGLMFPIDRNNQLGFVLKDLFNPGSNHYGPSVELGYSHRQGDIANLLFDMEYGSGGVTRFHPGVEWLLARGVLRPRIGWGYHDSGGIDTFAVGVGFYVSPWQVDIAYLFPLKSINDTTDQVRMSLSYKFGRPQFSEIYYDRALEAASKLDQNVLMMTTKEAELKASLAELEQKKRLAVDDLQNAKSRIQALQNKDLLGERDAVIRDLKNRIQELQGSLAGERGTIKAIRQKQNAVRTHRVSAGETLQSIAREYYGDPNQWKKIYSANADKIERGLPKPGSTLVIP
jgi:LysM repeat protein